MNPARIAIQFAGETGEQRIETATDFAVFWRDQFGTVHYMQVPNMDREDGFDWQAWFREEHDPDAPPKAINRDETGLAE